MNLLDDRIIVSASCGLAHTAAVSKYGDGKYGDAGVRARVYTHVCVCVCVCLCIFTFHRYVIFLGT